MKAIVYFTSVLFFLNACMFSDCKKADISSSERDWFKPYKVGQRIVFKSNQSNFDTLLVTTILDFYTSCNRLERGNFQFKNNGVKLSSQNYKDIIYSKFQATETNTVQRSFMFVDLYAYYHGNDIDKFAHIIKLESMADSISVYTFNKSNAESEGRGLINSFSWSKDLGIVRYVTKDDEIFELVK